VPWELYEMLNLAAAVERAREFDIIPLRGRVLPDVARLHPAVAIADRPDAAPFASAAEVALWSRYPEAHFRHLEPSRPSCCRGNVVATVLHGYRHRQLHLS